MGIPHDLRGEFPRKGIPYDLRGEFPRKRL